MRQRRRAADLSKLRETSLRATGWRVDPAIWPIISARDGGVKPSLHAFSSPRRVPGWNAPCSPSPSWPEWRCHNFACTYASVQVFSPGQLFLNWLSSFIAWQKKHQTAGQGHCHGKQRQQRAIRPGRVKGPSQNHRSDGTCNGIERPGNSVEG